MADATVILLQKQESHLKQLLKKTMAGDVAKRLVTKKTAPLLRVAFTAQGLVVWDLAGYEDADINELIREMASDRVGVLLTLDYQLPAFYKAYAQVNPLGIIPPGQTPEALGVTLELAWANHRRAHVLRGELDELRTELSDRLVVEKAKRLLMDSLGCSESEAMRRLQRYSRNTNQKLAKLAQQLIAGHMVFGDDGDLV